MPSHILLLIPTPFEAAALPRPAPFTSSHATIHTRITGIGAEAIRRNFRSAMDTGTFDAVLLAGFAGALHPDFTVTSCHECSPINETAEAYHHRLQQWPVPHIGDRPLTSTDQPGVKVVSTATVVATAAAKHQLHSETGAHLVDMEGAQFVEIARTHGMPWRIIRCVSDGAGQDLPTNALNAGFDAATLANTPLRLLFYLVTQPRDILPFFAFIRNLGPARRNLTYAIMRACGSG